MIAVIPVFVACFMFWVLLSGHLTSLSLALGVGSAALVAWANRGQERLSPALRAFPPRAHASDGIQSLTPAATAT